MFRGLCTLQNIVCPMPTGELLYATLVSVPEWNSGTCWRLSFRTGIFYAHPRAFRSHSNLLKEWRNIAYRNAVQPDTSKFHCKHAGSKCETCGFLPLCNDTCFFCGKPHVSKAMHVDHIHFFSHIVRSYEAECRKLPRVRFLPGYAFPQLSPVDEADFRTFHESVAEYRMLCRSCNLRRPMSDIMAEWTPAAARQELLRETFSALTNVIGTSGFILRLCGAIARLRVGKREWRSLEDTFPWMEDFRNCVDSFD